MSDSREGGAEVEPTATGIRANWRNHEAWNGLTFTRTTDDALRLTEVALIDNFLQMLRAHPEGTAVPVVLTPDLRLIIDTELRRRWSMLGHEVDLVNRAGEASARRDKAAVERALPVLRQFGERYAADPRKDEYTVTLTSGSMSELHALLGFLNEDRTKRSGRSQHSTEKE